MYLIFVKCMFVPALFSCPSLEPRITQTAGLWTVPSQWAKHGFVSLPATEVPAALGQPEEIWRKAGKVSWHPSTGKSSEYSRHIWLGIQGGWDVESLEMRRKFYRSELDRAMYGTGLFF